MSTVAAASAHLPPALPTLARQDFPSWLPATLVKELRQGLRTRGFVGSFIGFQILMALLMTIVAASSWSRDGVITAGAFNTANGFFWGILTLQLLVFTPARALGSLQLEVSSRTIDLLMLTRLDAWRIVMGKWASLVAQSALLLVAVLPYGIVRYFVGSVDLVQDARRGLAIFGAGMLLTAAALWGAGMGKIFRFVIIGLVVFFFSAGSSAFSAFMRGGGPLAAMGGVKGAAIGMVWFDGLLFGAFFLIMAVRNIAPRAENYAWLVRLLPLIALLPIPVGSAIVGVSLAINAQLLVSGFFLILVAAIELANLELPLFVHFQAARKRSALPRVLLRMTLPGWQSAYLYVIFATVLWVACVLSISAVSATGAPGLDLSRMIWTAVLAMAALTFPSLVLSFLPRAPRGAAGVYIATLVASAAMTPVGYALASTTPKLAFLKTALGVFPGASFLATLIDPSPPVSQVVFQAVFAVVVIVGAWWQTRGYWQYLTVLEARAERA